MEILFFTLYLIPTYRGILSVRSPLFCIFIGASGGGGGEIDLHRRRGTARRSLSSR